MSDRSKIGPRIDSELWNEFRENVRERKGQVRGVLGDELENAIREYINGDPDRPSQRIDARLARIENAVGVSSTDGGVTPSEREDTHTRPSRLNITEKPAANASTDKKVEYLAGVVEEQHSIYPTDPGMVPKSVLVELVKEEYGFRSDTAKRYVERLIERFGLVDHPDENYPQLVTKPKYEELQEEREKQLQEEASETIEELDQ